MTVSVGFTAVARPVHATLGMTSHEGGAGMICAVNIRQAVGSVLVISLVLGVWRTS
jgi:hypothetical protein